ncbi:MAG: carboxypeptidase-like regulatory domain-containing protein [Bacteroidota bacterium]
MLSYFRYGNAMKYVSFILVGLLLFSCKNNDDDTEPINCTTEFVYGLTVQVRDANTGGIIVSDITVTARDEPYEEELVFLFDTFIGAGERAGNYTLTVQADGYLTLITPVIEVGANECHVIGQFVELELQPL